MSLNIEEIEKRLVGLDDEIHRLLHYIYKSKEPETEVELRDYEDLKRVIARNLKEPLDPSTEIRKMRERRYWV
jgi:hypothetical protein